MNNLTHAQPESPVAPASTTRSDAAVAALLARRNGWL